MLNIELDQIIEASKCKFLDKKTHGPNLMLTTAIYDQKKFKKIQSIYIGTFDFKRGSTPKILEKS